MINPILEYLKNGVFLNVGPNSYMNAYTIIQKYVDKYIKSQLSDYIIEYYNKKIQDFIEYCYSVLK